MRAYKVVSVQTILKNNITEYFSSFIENEYRVKYIPGEWVEPKIGKLFCYKENKDIFLPFIGYELWEAEIIPSDIQDIEIVNPYIASYDGNLIYLFWKNKMWNRLKNIKGDTLISDSCDTDLFELELLPENTILADKVKLLQKVL